MSTATATRAGGRAGDWTWSIDTDAAAEMAPPSTGRMLRKKDLAEKFGVHLMTVDRWLKSGKLPNPAGFAGGPFWFSSQFGEG